MANFAEKSMTAQECLSIFTFLVFPKQPYLETLSMNVLQDSSTLASSDQFLIADLKLKANTAFLLPADCAEIIPDLIQREMDVLGRLFV